MRDVNIGKVMGFLKKSKHHLPKPWDRKQMV